MYLYTQKLKQNTMVNRYKLANSGIYKLGVSLLIVLTEEQEDQESQQNGQKPRHR